MNLNREQFLKAVERGQALLKALKKDYPELGLKPVFSRFGPRSGQCDLTTDLKKIVMEFPEMLEEEGFLAKTQRPQREGVGRLRTLLNEIRKAEKDGEKETASKLRKEAAAVEKELLDFDLMLYCGDVLVEYRPENLTHESLRRLQQDPRLPPGLNEVGNIRVIAGSLLDLKD
ncbi:MAG: hypothetical protein HOO88_00200 [Kiritimatiellaceae bacterium]|nr:hypothetical protein [Kiritimatiellaceae bacterium]